MDSNLKPTESGVERERGDLEMQKSASNAVEMTVTFDPSICKSLKMKADLILIPLLSLAYLFK